MRTIEKCLFFACCNHIWQLKCIKPSVNDSFTWHVELCIMLWPIHETICAEIVQIRAKWSAIALKINFRSCFFPPERAAGGTHSLGQHKVQTLLIFYCYFLFFHIFFGEGWLEEMFAFVSRFFFCTSPVHTNVGGRMWITDVRGVWLLNSESERFRPKRSRKRDVIKPGSGATKTKWMQLFAVQLNLIIENGLGATRRASSIVSGGEAGARPRRTSLWPEALLTLVIVVVVNRQPGTALRCL